MFESCFTFTEKYSNQCDLQQLLNHLFLQLYQISNLFFLLAKIPEEPMITNSILSCSYSTEQGIKNWKIDTFVSNPFVFTDFLKQSNNKEFTYERNKIQKNNAFLPRFNFASRFSLQCLKSFYSKIKSFNTCFDWNPSLIEFSTYLFKLRAIITWWRWFCTLRVR